MSKTLEEVKQKKEVVQPERPTPRRKPVPCVDDWEFWRFILAALSLAWEVAKTFVR